jgi:hypothetical protein
MELFNNLGRDIEARWLALDYDESALPGLAANALRDHNLPAKTTLWEVLEWALGEYELPRQRDLPGRFADPPVTVFSGLRFHIDVYLWFEATTAIHQHGFCGAFQVLHGSSIHSWYTFERERAVSFFAETGRIELKLCELLEVGAVQEILPGRQYIHSLFHLDRPSATIVVRTHLSPLEMPQYSYFKPNLAIDPFFEQETAVKKMQLAGALIRAGHDGADEIIEPWLAAADFHTAYLILKNLHHLLGASQVDELFGVGKGRGRFERFLAAAEKRHGEGVFRAAFDYQERENAIVRQRSLVSDPEQRFFIALLLNVPTRQQIFEIITKRFPNDEPVEKVLDWTFDLVNTRIAGSEKANVLGTDLDQLDLFVFEQVLKGKAGEEITGAFKAENGEPNESHDLARREARIRGLAILRPLFS